ncbi:hypothetical protein GQ457_07G030530 [Hibiscus cannabinus]
MLSSLYKPQQSTVFSICIENLFPADNLSIPLRNGFLVQGLLFCICVCNEHAFDGQGKATGPPKTATSDLLARLKLDVESPDCWNSLIQLQSCTGELIMFFLNGETEIGQSCCHAILTVSNRCWPNMIDTLGFTTEETLVVEGYCVHEDDQSTPSVAVTNDVGSSKSLNP